MTYADSSTSTQTAKTGNYINTMVLGDASAVCTVTDGANHSYYVYAINDGAYGGINNPLLSNSPKSVSCDVATPGSLSVCVNGDCSNPPAAPNTPRTLTWNCPAPYTSSSGIGFSTGGALTGSITVSPTDTTDYEISCNPGNTATKITVSVVNPQLTLTAPTPRVRPGQTTSLVWSAAQVNSCMLSAPGGAVMANVAADENGLIVSRTNQTGVITGRSTYTLTCQTAIGARSVSVDVGLIPSVIEL